MSEDSNIEPISWSQLHVLRAISQGYCRASRIREVLRVSASTLKQQVDELKCMGLITKEGLLSRSWKLTVKGMDILGSYGFSPEIPPPSSTQTRRTEIRHTSTIGTGFKLAFGALIGIFVAWLVIGCVASLFFWFGYQFLIRHYLPYIPLDNPLVDLALGFMASTAFFLPLRNRLRLPSFIAGD